MRLFVLAMMSALCGCETVDATALPTGIPLMVVVDNPKVIVDGFEAHLKRSLTEHGIAVQSAPIAPANATSYVLTYTARQGWDFTTFLNYADISVSKAGRSIATATYRHAGGLSLLKWQSVETKMGPVYEKLLVNYPLIPRWGQ